MHEQRPTHNQENDKPELITGVPDFGQPASESSPTPEELSSPDLITEVPGFTSADQSSEVGSVDHNRDPVPAPPSASALARAAFYNNMSGATGVIQHGGAVFEVSSDSAEDDS